MKRWLYIMISGLLVSCQEEVFLDLKTTDPVPVIEAVWTDVSSLNQVQVTMSKDYYEGEENLSIKDATVYIINKRNGLRTNFRYADQIDKYLPLNNQSGSIGETYELNVEIGEMVYSAEGTLLPPPVMDSVTYAFKQARLFREEGYYISLHGKIPFTENNNYRVRLVRNDTLLNRRTDYLLFDDTFGTGILDNGFELGGFPFKKNDRVRLELYRLNQDAYDYINQLVNLLFNDGGLFSPPPQNPRSNISIKAGSGEVLGYFMVSPILTETVHIDPD